VSDARAAEYLASLIKERDGYLAAGLQDRAAEVAAELARVGHKTKTPAARSTKRAAAKPADRSTD